MKTFDAAISTELAKESFQPYWLLDIATTTPMRYTDLDLNTYHGGNLYVSRGMKIGNITSGATVSAEKVEIELDDADQVITAFLLNEDVRNKAASLYFGVIARTAVGLETQLSRHVQEVWRGFVSGWELAGEADCRITLTHEFVLWNKEPLRTQSSSCQWTFKGTECGYSGEAGWCDKSFDRCKKLSNSDNFGGFRFIPEIAEKEIWWGRNPTKALR
jgi:hypothetical protein